MAPAISMDSSYRLSGVLVLALLLLLVTFLSLWDASRLRASLKGSKAQVVDLTESARRASAEKDGLIIERDKSACVRASA